MTRLHERTLNDDVSVEAAPEYFEAIAALPEVEAAAPASFMFVFPRGLSANVVLTLASTDGRFGSVVNRPLLLSGRRPAPSAVDEVFVNTEVADRLELEPGDVITMTSLAPDQLERLIVAGRDPGEPAGPQIDVTVAGIGRTSVEVANQTPILLFTPAFYAAHRDDVAHFDDILGVRLGHSDRDVESFRAGVEGIVPDPKA